MLCTAVANYIKNAKGLPFFYVVGDSEYCSTLDELRQQGLTLVRVSDFCIKDDKFPDIDELVDFFRTGDVDFRDNKYVVVGLGEYLALRGKEEIESELRRMKNTTLGNARVVILLRGVASQMTAMISNDIKLSGQGRSYIASDIITNLSAINISQDIGIVENKGVKWLLRAFEDGATAKCKFSSKLLFKDSIIPIPVIDDAYSALTYLVKGFPIAKVFGSNEQWEKLLDQMKNADYSLDKLFEKYGIDSDFESNFYAKVSGREFNNWLFFLALKYNPSAIKNAYLQYVVERTSLLEDLKSNILTFITLIPHTAKNFKKLYDDRKTLVKNFPESEIAIFVNANAIDPTEEIYKYTDNTPIERRSVVKWIAKNGLNEAIAYVYPALASYLKKFVFTGGTIAGDLTNYFTNYKYQKVTNKLDEAFLELVDEYGKAYKYAKLQTRDDAIKAIKDKSSAYLYWIDAMGVEYLSYITDLAKEKGLSIHIDITRADLPTITEINKSFYDNWTGKDKYKEEALDDIKHNDKGGFFFTDCKEPIYIASELEVIRNAIDSAAMKLAMHECKSFIIASDHGASRLAVLRKKEEKYDTDTVGEHSGRCCKVFEGYDLPHAIEEKGYLVLTDYGRFKGSRAANVEVHGGATLEEVVVPVITLRLKKDHGIDIRVLNADSLQADRKDGTLVKLYISDVDNVDRVSLMVNGNRYFATADDHTHYTVTLTDIKRSKKCTAEIYDGDDLLGSIELTIKGKSGNVDKSFDSEFDEF